ncbi:MAG: endolytic transglycosylase MltG [Anaerolineae bacterium]|nr:endolytic transglycosylase MltG [Anaerolineae bacterium]
MTIRSGLRREQIAEIIDSLPVGFYGRDFLAVTGPGASVPARDFLSGMPPGASLEGYLWPGTYTLTNEMDATAFREMLLDAFGAATGDLWGSAALQGLSPYETVTLASIIVRESRDPASQPLISSVFHNRLRVGRGLGASVTTQYALGRPGAWWPSPAGYVSTLASPYNTNIYRGLPPTPISSPDRSALQAAANPAESAYQFFSANCRGPGIYFAETYEQHLANVRCE